MKEKKMVTECPACKKEYKSDEKPHKLMLFDVSPSFKMGPRMWICEVTAEMFHRMLATFDSAGEDRCYPPVEKEQ